MEQLVAAETYACARLEGGSVHCWGNERIPGLAGFAYTPKRVPGFGGGAVSLFSELGSACAGTADRTLWCWGGNSGGVLGRARDFSSTDQAIKHVLRDVTAMAMWGRCAISEKKLRCWNALTATNPTEVTELPAAPTLVTGGQSFACVLLQNGQVWCKGTNLDGQRGTGNVDVGSTPGDVQQKDTFTRVEALGSDVAQIASGAEFSCALKKDGSVWCWGKNDHGEAGNGTLRECKTTPDVQWVCAGSVFVPERVKVLPPVKQISAGSYSACALEASGKAWCWGADVGTRYIDGKAQRSENALTPKPVPIVAPIRSVAPGSYYTCVVLRTGKVQCWGQIGEFHKDWHDPADVPFDCGAK